MSAELQERLFEWRLRVARAIVALSSDDLRRLDAWRERNLTKSDEDWPQVQAVAGTKPVSTPLRLMKRRSA